MRKLVLPARQPRLGVPCVCEDDQPSLKSLLDSSVDVICSIDKDGKFTYVSAAAKRVWGYDPSELVGRKYMELIVPSDQERTAAAAASVMLGREVTSFENNYIRKDGNLVPILWSAKWNKREQVMYCVAKDNSERKEAERRDKERIANVYDSIQDGYFSVDKNFTVLQWNKKSEQILLKKKEDILGKNLWEEYHEAIPLKFFTEYNRTMRENTSVHFEEYVPSLAIWFQVSAYPSAEGLSIYFQNINDRKRQQQELELANERFELASKATSDVLWDWDIESNDCYFNDNFTRLYGHENKADSVYKNWLSNIHPDDKKELLQSLNDTFLNPSLSKFEASYRFYRKDGTIAHVLDRGFIIRDGHGEPIRMVGSMQDITRLLDDEAQMQRLALIAKETVNAVIITDKDQRITWVNQAFTHITEYSFEEALGKKPSELLQGKKTSAKAKAYLREQIQKGLPFQCDMLNYSKSGREYWIELKGQPILNDKGEMEQFFAIQTDISERIELQKMVVQKEIETQRDITRAMITAQEKERTEIGKELHDNVNQLLATIKLYLENIRNFPEHREMFIENGIELAKKAMNESRNLSHRLVASSIADTSFRSAIEEMLSHYQLLNIFSIQHQFTVCEEKLDAAFRLTIYRIVQECLTNVVKYAKASEVKVAILYEDQLVKVMISDNGVGFDDARTKGGIGLTNIRNRASLFKGTVQVASAPGKGSSINVFFPTINDQVIAMDERV